MTNWKGRRHRGTAQCSFVEVRNERTWLFFVTASQSSTRSTFSVSGMTSRISGLRVPSSSSRPLFVPRPPSLRRPPPGCAPRAAFEVLEAEALVDVAAACARERSFWRERLASLNLRRRVVGTHSSQLRKKNIEIRKTRDGIYRERTSVSTLCSAQGNAAPPFLASCSPRPKPRL